MDSYNSTLDHSLYEAVSSAKSCVSSSSASSGLSTNSQTALLHKKSNNAKRSKRRPHSAVVVSHLSHPDPSKLETLATFPPLQPTNSDPNSGILPSDSTKTSQTPLDTPKTGKTKCQLCALYSLFIVFVVMLLALILSIVLLVQLPSDSNLLASISSSYNDSSPNNYKLNKVRVFISFHYCLHIVKMFKNLMILSNNMAS